MRPRPLSREREHSVPSPTFPSGCLAPLPLACCWDFSTSPTAVQCRLSSPLPPRALQVITGTCHPGLPLPSGLQFPPSEDITAAAAAKFSPFLLAPFTLYPTPFIPSP